MHKESIHTDQAPAAIGPYSQAIRSGDFIFASGQGGLDPVSGKRVEGGVAAQAEQVMRNLAAVLEAAGANLACVVKTTIFLRHIKDFATVNEVYARYIGDPKPARSTIAAAALPMGALVEIEVIARLPVPAAPAESPVEKKAKGKKKGKKKSKK